METTNNKPNNNTPKATVYVIDLLAVNDSDDRDFTTITKQACEVLVTEHVAQKLDIATFERLFNEDMIASESIVRIFIY